MYCKHCGREIDDNSSFCKYCGKPQDNSVSTPNGVIDFITKKPILSSYILWVIINLICLCRGDKVGNYFNLLYPRFYNGGNYFDLDYYQITDFIVYTILIPLVIYLGYHYFKKVTSTKYRIYWALWFMFHILMYDMSNLSLDDYFFPFTMNESGSPLFVYDAYDLSELVFYTMIIPIIIWGYKYKKNKKKEIHE